MKTLAFVMLSFISVFANAEFKEPKFGKITSEELTLNQYDKDTTADAVILFDNGSSAFAMNTSRQFVYNFERHVRIKIFKKSAFNIAEFTIPLRQNGNRHEKLVSIKAATYNVVGGKMLTTKLDKDNIFEEESKYLTTKKFALPDVKEGSIIELSYSITSDFLYNFRGWEFQYHYPAVWSQYKATIPEYFMYRQSTKGYLPFAENSSEQSQATYTLHYDATIEGGLGGGRTPSENYDIKAVTTEFLFATKDVPAFYSEPNIDCEDNYIQSLEFELSSIQYPQDIRKDYTQSWESVNTMMNDDEDFGHVLNSKGFIEDTVAKLCKGITSDLDKATIIYNYVQHRMKWNEKHRIYSDRGLKKPFNERSGSSCEINMLLTLMLKTAGLHAFPVLFSTRENGVAVSYYPTITKFNSVLSKVEIEGITYLLDATANLCPFGTLPASDINGQGRVVNSANGDWVDLDTKIKHSSIQTSVLAIQPDGKITGDIQERLIGYAAVEQRNVLASVKDDDTYIRKIQEFSPGLVINGYSFKDKNNIYMPFSDSLNVEISDKVEVMGDKLMFKPLLYETMDKNIYTLEQRSYPVNYNYPIVKSYIYEYAIPEGYMVESLPQSGIFKLPDGSITMTYNIKLDNNKIRLIYKQNISKSLFLPAEYQGLKEFYDLIVKKHAEQVILKKV